MSDLRTRFLKTSRWFVLLFAALFLFRIISGYASADSGISQNPDQDFFSNIGNLRKNYASEKFQIQGNNATGSAFNSNQKFEKTATIKSKSPEFETDEKLIKQKTKSFNGVIQYEQNLGRKGNREIHLLIGITPDAFDSFYNEIQQIGKLSAKEITKVDKTTEYRELNAKKTSIEKALNSLNELKTKAGQLSDFVALNDKILEIEQKLQELGVELGNFAAENEFCTVRISLYEGATERKITLLSRIKVSLEWTIKYFALIVTGIFAASLSIFLLLLIADKLKILNALINKNG